jgi:hypothetical protein
MRGIVPEASQFLACTFLGQRKSPPSLKAVVAISIPEDVERILFLKYPAIIPE